MEVSIEEPAEGKKRGRGRPRKKTPGEEMEDMNEEEKKKKVQEAEERKEKNEEQCEDSEERQEVFIDVFRMATPLPSSRGRDVVLKAIVDMYLRLRADGYEVTQLHTDNAGEFTSQCLSSWCTSRSILPSFTPGDQPQANGRVSDQKDAS